MDDFFASFSYSYAAYDPYGGFNSVGGSGYAGQNITYQGTTVTTFDAFTSNPYLTNTTTTGFTLDQSIVGTANYQIGVDYTNNAVYGFANPNTGGTQALSLDNTYYNIQNGSDAYLTTQFNKLGSIATIQTATATVIGNTILGPDSGEYGKTLDTTVADSDVIGDNPVFDPTVDFNPSDTSYRIKIDQQGDLTVGAADYQATILALFDETRSVVPATISSAVEEALITTQAFQTGTTNVRVIGPGIDVYGNEAQTEIDIGGRTQSYYDRIQEIAFSQAEGDTAFASLVRPADFGFDLATSTFASDEDAEQYGLAVQQRVVDVITSGIRAVDNNVAIASQIISLNPEIFATKTVAADGETYYTVKSLFDIAETLREVSQDPAVVTIIGRQIAAAGGDVSKADLRASTVIPLVEQLKNADVVDDSTTQTEINILVAEHIATNGTISEDQYIAIQNQVVQSSRVKLTAAPTGVSAQTPRAQISLSSIERQPAPVTPQEDIGYPDYSFNFGGGGGGGDGPNDPVVDTTAQIQAAVAAGEDNASIIARYSAADLYAAYPEFGSLSDYETLKGGGVNTVNTTVSNNAATVGSDISPGTLDINGNPQFYAGSEEFVRADQIAREASRADLRRAATDNGFPPDAVVTAVAGERVYLVIDQGPDRDPKYVDITEYFEGNPKPPVAIDIGVEAYGKSTVDTGFRTVEIQALPNATLTVNTSQGEVQVDPNSEVARFLQWQGSQPNPNGPGTIGDVWARQGISDPYSNPLLVERALDQIASDDRRQALYDQSGVTPASGTLAPWNDPNWPKYQGSNKEAFETASRALTDFNYQQQIRAENGWDQATFNSWALRITDPDAWAAAAAESDLARGVVVGGGQVNSTTGLSANNATVVTTTGQVDSRGFPIFRTSRAVGFAEDVADITGTGASSLFGDEDADDDTVRALLAEDLDTNTVGAEFAGTNADAEDAFTSETETGLLTVPEDQFVETDGGLFVLEDELEVSEDDILTDEDTTVTEDPSYDTRGTPFDDDGNLNPGWAINPETGEAYYIGGDYIDPSTIAQAAADFEAARVAALKTLATQQNAIALQRKQANEGDWRVRLRLAPGADYLYKDPDIEQDGVLWPLSITDGVVFPYTPQINTTYGANYNSYDLTHSNYRGYFYQNSYVDEIQITATFTAQDTNEANYLLAVIHFFKSVTKMFYGQDAQRGAPPPLVFLQGLGEFQFNLHPCVVKTFNYNLPADVDYIRARSVNINGTNLLQRRDRQTVATNPLSGVIDRLRNAGLPLGALASVPAPQTLGTNNPTYVPTKLDIQLGLLPIQTRQQVSKQFSVKSYANGDLLKGGFW